MLEPYHFDRSTAAQKIRLALAVDRSEFNRQTDEYAAAWRAKGFPCRRVEMNACNHFDLPLELSDPASMLTHAVFEQMGL